MKAFLTCVLSLTIIAGAIGVARGGDDTVVSAPFPPPPDKATPARKAAWAAAIPRIRQAELDSQAAIKSQLARIDEFFAARKEGARPFAAAVLGTEGKLQAAGAAVEGAVKVLDELFGSKPARGPDSFTLYVGRSFRQHVLDTGELQKAIDDSVAAYRGELQRLEGKLLVDLRADLDDTGLDFAGALPGVRANDAVGNQGNAMIAEAVKDAAGDFSAMIVKFAVSTAIGNAVSDRLTRKEDSGLKKLGVNLAVGAAVDGAIDAGLAQAGYDPERDLSAKVTASLDRMRARLVDGDPRAVEAYLYLRLNRLLYIDPAVHAACRRATDAIEGSGDLGLRQTLLVVHDRRVEARRAGLYRLILGTDPAVQPSLRLPMGDQITKYAQQCEAYWKGRNH